MSAVICVVAGLSSRMGAFKPLLPLGDQSIIRTLITRYRSCGVDQVILVTGHNADLLEDHVRDLPVRCYRNERYAESDMFQSVKIGIKAYLDDGGVQSDDDRVFITPGDIPLVSERTINALLKASGDAYVPVTESKRGHPLCLSNRILPGILSYAGDSGLRGALEELGVEVDTIPVDDPGILFDADTPEDYERLLNLYRDL